MTAQVTINLSTNSGDSCEGAIVHFINQDNHPLHDYTIAANESGFAEAEIWKGIYDFSVMLSSFETLLVQNEEIFDDTNLNLNLQELLNNTPSFSVISYTICIRSDLR